MTNKFPEGTRVRITIEATADGDGDFMLGDALTDDTRYLFKTHLDRGNATYEMIEDLRDGDIYLDAEGDPLRRLDGRWVYGYDELSDGTIARPLTLLVRDGKPVAGGS